MLKKITENILKDGLSVIIKHAIYIILLSSLIGFAVNLFHPKEYILISKETERNKNIILISSDEAKIKKDSQSAIFVDSRPYDEFEISHIPGAISIPALPESESLIKIKEYSGVLNSAKEVVIYCDGVKCGSSQILADTLIGTGYSRHVYIIKNGLPEWQEKDFPLEKKNDAENKDK